MEIRVLMIQVTCMFFLNVNGNIYTLKHICPPELTKTLRKYDCVYYGPSVTSTPNARSGGIISECCENMCTEYYLVTSYCKRSTIVDFVTERSEMLNVITKDRGELSDIRRIEGKDDVTERIVDNMVLKETTKVSKSEGAFKRNSNKTNKRGKGKSKKLKNRKRVKINRNCACECKKPKRKATVYKPAVFVLSKISPNSPIPVPRRSIHRR